MPLPEEVSADELDPQVRRELRSLPRDTAELVARHLVRTGQLVDDEPDEALRHAQAAVALAGRVADVRLTAGLAAYAAGQWRLALSELHAARRINGRAEALAVVADCERGLGRPERALAVGDDPAVTALETGERVELTIVLAGARRDLGQPGAAVLLLQEPARRTRATMPWAARIWYAYADALLADDRPDVARDWFSRVVDLDREGETDAADRLLALDGVQLSDLADAAADPDAGEPGDDRGDDTTPQR